MKLVPDFLQIIALRCDHVLNGLRCEGMTGHVIRLEHVRTADDTTFCVRLFADANLTVHDAM